MKGADRKSVKRGKNADIKVTVNKDGSTTTGKEGDGSFHEDTQDAMDDADFDEMDI